MKIQAILADAKAGLMTMLALAWCAIVGVIAIVGLCVVLAIYVFVFYVGCAII